MAKTASECAGQILSTISTSLLEMAAQASARVSVLEEENAALQTQLREAKASLAMITTPMEPPPV